MHMIVSRALKATELSVLNFASSAVFALLKRNFVIDCQTLVAGFSGSLDIHENIVFFFALLFVSWFKVYLSSNVSCCDA